MDPRADGKAPCDLLYRLSYVPIVRSDGIRTRDLSNASASTRPGVIVFIGANGGNRTRVICLEGRGSAIELRSRIRLLNCLSPGFVPFPKFGDVSRAHWVLWCAVP